MNDTTEQRRRRRRRRPEKMKPTAKDVNQKPSPSLASNARIRFHYGRQSPPPSLVDVLRILFLERNKNHHAWKRFTFDLAPTLMRTSKDGAWQQQRTRKGAALMCRDVDNDDAAAAARRWDHHHHRRHWRSTLVRAVQGRTRDGCDRENRQSNNNRAQLGSHDGSLTTTRGVGE